MAEIQIILDQHGDVQIIPVGFNGNECLKATAGLEAAFGTEFSREAGEGVPVIPVEGGRAGRQRATEEI